MRQETTARVNLRIREAPRQYIISRFRVSSAKREIQFMRRKVTETRPTILTNHFGLYEATTCAITNPNNNPGPYPITTAFQFNTSSSSSSSSSLGCCVGGTKQLPWRGRPHRPTFPSNDDSACPLNCGPCGISPLSLLCATLM